MPKIVAFQLQKIAKAYDLLYDTDVKGLTPILQSLETIMKTKKYELTLKRYKQRNFWSFKYLGK